MAIPFTVYPIARLVCYEVEGAVTDSEATTFLDAVLTHPRFKRGFDFLGEAQVTGEPDGAFPPALAGVLQARASEVNPCRWGVVVASRRGVDSVRLWAEFVAEDGVEVAPFMNHSAAVDWLEGNG